MGTVLLLLTILIPIAYLSGSIPFGLLIALGKGVDPRTAGSGNIGATNVGRLLGGRFFAIVFALDVLKSLIPMLAAGAIVHRYAPATPFADWWVYLLWLLVGLGAILGHMFPFALGFKGGKGVATSAGVILGLYPFYTLPGLTSIAIWLIVFLIWRYISLASIVGAVSFPVAYAIIGHLRHWRILEEQLPLLLFALVIAALVILRHRSNITRLMTGTEHGFRKSKIA